MTKPTWFDESDRDYVLKQMGKSYMVGLSALKQFTEEEFPEVAQSTLREKQHLLVTLESGEDLWVTAIIIPEKNDDPLLCMLVEDLRSKAVYRAVVPRSRVISMKEIPESMLRADEPRPQFGFHPSHLQSPAGVSV